MIEDQGARCLYSEFSERRKVDVTERYAEPSGSGSDMGGWLDSWVGWVRPEGASRGFAMLAAHTRSHVESPWRQGRGRWERLVALCSSMDGFLLPREPDAVCAFGLQSAAVGTQLRQWERHRRPWCMTAPMQGPGLVLGGAWRASSGREARARASKRLCLCLLLRLRAWRLVWS